MSLSIRIPPPLSVKDQQESLKKYKDYLRLQGKLNASALNAYNERFDRDTGLIAPLPPRPTESVSSIIQNQVLSRELITKMIKEVGYNPQETGEIIDLLSAQHLWVDFIGDGARFIHKQHLRGATLPPPIFVARFVRFLGPRVGVEVKEEVHQVHQVHRKVPNKVHQHTIGNEDLTATIANLKPTSKRLIEEKKEDPFLTAIRSKAQFGLKPVSREQIKKAMNEAEAKSRTRTPPPYSKESTKTHKRSKSSGEGFDATRITHIKILMAEIKAGNDNPRLQIELKKLLRKHK